MQFIDLKSQYLRIKDMVSNNIQTVLNSGQYIMGAEISQLEKELSVYVGVKHCLSCASGTDALLIPLMAWGIGEGDAVFTTPFTFIATAEVISLVGATPIFVDIDRDTFNINPELLDEAIQKVKNERKLNTKAIIPVDLFGLCANYSRINEIAKKHNLIVLEDAAQAFGAVQNGKKSCSFGTAAATSFFPAKPLGCYGDGGAVFTDDDNLIEIMKSIRIHGQGSDKYENVRIGLNGRMDTIQAAVLLAKLTIFDEEIELRNIIAKRYNELLKDKLVVPFTPEDNISVWAQYSVLAKSSEERQKIQDALKQKGIPTAIYYPIPLHLQKAYSYLNYKQGDFPVSEEIAKRVFSLPMHPYLTEEEQKNICNAIA
ncbi:MAG TPA: DegT/DnrJ/EryC1/StrS family aminotransferase [Candidatus Kapabacteria bacterium]|nr:DegT/DnrJ/EryC1/StrS family aminotransferase [Candidatus Kapabacteria bacterium]